MLYPVGLAPTNPGEDSCCCCWCCCGQPVEYCGAEGPVEEGETALIFGKRERALAVWSMNGLFESSAMDVSETVSVDVGSSGLRRMTELPDMAVRREEPMFGAGTGAGAVK